jgi:5'-3' exonuclease
MTARLLTTHGPDRLVACWDDDWRPAFRVEALPSYKAHRVAPEGGEEVPDELSPQVPILIEVLAAAGIDRVGAPGYEADDIIGTLATRARGPVDVVTGDRDLFQLVDDARGVRVLYTARGIGDI